MNGPWHYKEAERLLTEAAEHDAGGASSVLVMQLAARAQAHAELAKAAAAAYPAVRDWIGDETSTDSRAWAEATAPDGDR